MNHVDCPQCGFAGLIEVPTLNKAKLANVARQYIAMSKDPFAVTTVVGDGEDAFLRTPRDAGELRDLGVSLDGYHTLAAISNWDDEPTRAPKPKTWEELAKRFMLARSPDAIGYMKFYACLSEDDGQVRWFDSSESFETAVHWCYMAFGKREDLDFCKGNESRWFDMFAMWRGLSIVHANTLKQMAQKGLIK